MRFVIALLLLFSVTPGVSEVFELATHVVLHGDLPHHEDADAIECDEHACTPLAHHCSCHTAMSAQTPARTIEKLAIPPQVHAMSATAVGPDVLGRNGEPPPLRPPIV